MWGSGKDAAASQKGGGEWPCGPGEQIRSPPWALKGFLVWKALMKVSFHPLPIHWRTYSTTSGPSVEETGVRCGAQPGAEGLGPVLHLHPEG